MVTKVESLKPASDEANWPEELPTNLSSSAECQAPNSSKNDSDSRLTTLKKPLAYITLMVFVPLVGVVLWANYDNNASLLALVFLAGALGGLLSCFRHFRLIPTKKNGSFEYSYSIQVYLCPLIGGVFGLVAYVIFTTGIIQGDFFPKFNGLDNGHISLKDTFHSTLPVNTKDVAKTLLWTFLAGFSERFVPTILDNVAEKGMEK